MPFLISPDEMLMCIGEEIPEGQPWRPWKMVKVKNGEIIPIEFPHSESSYKRRHCSPILINGHLSVTYNGRVFTQNGSGWGQNVTPVHQGYFDGEHLNFVTKSSLVIGGKKLDSPFLHLLRVVPCDQGVIVTGITQGPAWSALWKNDGWYKILVNNNRVYKCHILRDRIAYAELFDIGVEKYQVKTANKFDLALL